MTDTPPIVVNTSVTQVTAEAEYRKFFIAIGPLVGFAAATGWGQKIGLAHWFTMAVTYAGPISAAIAWAWGFYETRKNAKKMVALKDHIDDPAVVVSK
jgi:hypothetical protein